MIENVIKGLECCLQTDDVTECQIKDCPYHHWRDTCTEWLMKDAIELLKEQKPRLINIHDFEYADGWGNIPAWCEYNPSLGVKTIDAWLLITIDHLHDKTARYWTQRPTEDQRKAVKWDGIG